MSIWSDAITSEAEKLIRRFENHARQVSDEYKRRVRRTISSVSKLRPQRPPYWRLAPGFDPYLTRARADRIGHSIQQRISTSTYSPRTPYLHFVPKAGGGQREICIFQVADAAVSGTIFSRLAKKNRALMSSRAYAYRDDVSAHDAIQYIAAEFRGQSRVFVAEYDFSKYFDSISHDYLWKILKNQKFLITRAEEASIAAFLRVQPLPAATYQQTAGPKRERGIPQGTSISLFWRMSRPGSWTVPLRNLG